MVSVVDYLGAHALHFDRLNHVQARGCHIAGRHAHVACAYCSQHFVLDLAKLDEFTRRRVQDHALEHWGG